MSKIVFITGATSGFGEACAHLFASHGYHCIINGRRIERLEHLATELKAKYGVDAYPLPFDVRNEKVVTDSINNLPASWKAIDVLINNAGLALGRDLFEEADMNDWNVMIDTNVKGFLYVAQAVAKLMSQNKRGHIINMGSIAGKEVYEKGNVYCASKFAVDAISKSMRIDLLRHGIKVTSINPGAAETEFSLVRFKGDTNTAASIYDGIKPLTASDVADVVFYCTTLPAHVCINDLSITCLQQASTVNFNRKM
jgi:3-hydroxy acid dehydrogenase/malonic semialdehyde reductase